MLGGFEVLVDPSGKCPSLYTDPTLVLSYSLSDKILFLCVRVVLTHLKPVVVSKTHIITVLYILAS